MIELIKIALYFMLPAYAANAVPRLAQYLELLPFLGKPVDCGKTFRGRRIFGAHKTWRGLLLAPAVGTIVGIIQGFVWQPDFFPYSGMTDYAVVGLLLGTGAILGDLAFAFLKRRIGIKEGVPWIPFDQLNFVIGALAFVSIFYIPPLAMTVLIVIISGLGHMAANWIAYILGIQKVKT